jgi:hypothetical protein
MFIINWDLIAGMMIKTSQEAIREKIPCRFMGFGSSPMYLIRRKQKKIKGQKDDTNSKRKN